MRCFSRISTTPATIATATITMCGLLLAAGCHSDHGNGDDGHGASGHTAALNVHVTTDPKPPIKGQNKWIVEVHDKNHARVAGATVTVEATMPSMGHGSSEKPAVKETTDGVFEVFPVTLQMAGEWKVVTTATLGADSATETGTYTVK